MNRWSKRDDIMFLYIVFQSNGSSITFCCYFYWQFKRNVITTSSYIDKQILYVIQKPRFKHVLLVLANDSLSETVFRTVFNGFSQLRVVTDGKTMAKTLLPRLRILNLRIWHFRKKVTADHSELLKASSYNPTASMCLFGLHRSFRGYSNGQVC